MGKTIRLLIVEDIEDDALLLVREIRKGGFELVFKRVDSEKALTETLKSETWDMIISDYAMPGFSGIDALRIAKKYDPDIPFILISGAIGEDVAVRAVKDGVGDYLMKDNLNRLVPAIERELHNAQERSACKKAEKELRESEERYRHLFSTISDAIMLFDSDTMKISDVNNAALDLYGYSREEFLNLTKADITAEQEKPDRSIKQTLSGEIDGIPLRNHKRKDGTIFPVEISKSTMKLGEETVHCEVIRDITERKQAEAVLQRSEERYRALFEDNPIETIVVDKDACITMYNKAKKTSGEELPCIGDVMYKDYATSHLIDMNRELMECIKLGTSKDFSNQNYKGRFLDIRMFHFEKGAIITAIDRTEKKNLETKLQRAQKMESLGLMAGWVAHDLNNILSAIVGFPELILMDLPEDSPFRESISIIQKSGEKAAVIVQDLLTLARRGVAITEVVNLNHIISEQLKSPEFKKLLSFNPNVKIKTGLEKDLLNIKGSSVHLSKSVMNLVSNAAEAMINGGTIFISTENRYIECPVKGYEHIEKGDYVTITVSDTGIGISSEDIEKIFEPFYTKKVMGRSGTGLGMAVIWGTVKDHEGYIDVQSTEGKGTTFTLYFPVTREEAVTDKTLLSIEDYMGKGETILVIDDVEEQQEIASVMLKSWGIRSHPSPAVKQP